MERNDVTATLCICNRDDLRSGWRCFADDHSVHLLLVAVICAGRRVWRRRRRSQFAPLHWTVSFHGVTQPTSRRCWRARADNVVHRNDVRRVFALCIRSALVRPLLHTRPRRSLFSTIDPPTTLLSPISALSRAASPLTLSSIAVNSPPETFRTPVADTFRRTSPC